MTAPTTPAPSSVATAAQSTVDRVTQIDQQVSAALGTSVDATVLPSLAVHLAALHATLSQWPGTIRPTVTKALGNAASLDQTVIASRPVDETNQAALKDFAVRLQQAMSTSQAAVGDVAAAVAPMRASLDDCLGALDSDSQAIASQVATDQDLLQQLEDQIDDDQDTIAEFHEDPWRFLLQGGGGIDGVLTELTQLLSSETNQQAVLDRAQSVLTAVQQLTDTGGTLSSLSSTVAGLSTSLVDTQTAVAQVSNALTEIIQQPPLPAILAAQLDAMVTDLESADKIIMEVTGTP